MDVSVGHVMDIMSMIDSGVTYLLVSGARYFLTRWNSKRQCPYIDFKEKQSVPAGFVALLIGMEGSSQCICASSQNCVLEATMPWAVRRKIVYMHKIRIPSNLMFSVHGYIRHAGAECSRKQLLRYHTYLVPPSQVPQDARHFPYGDSMGARVQVGYDAANLVICSCSILEDDWMHDSSVFNRVLFGYIH